MFSWLKATMLCMSTIWNIAMEVMNTMLLQIGWCPKSCNPILPNLADNQIKLSYTGQAWTGLLPFVTFSSNGMHASGGEHWVVCLCILENMWQLGTKNCVQICLSPATILISHWHIPITVSVELLSSPQLIYLRGVLPSNSVKHNFHPTGWPLVLSI